MRRRLFPILAVALMLGAGAGPVRAADAPPLSRGQTLYVPVYSHLLTGNADRSGKPDIALLAAMLSIRNTDPAHAITVTSIRYFDTGGRLIRDFSDKAGTLGPLATTDVFIENQDRAGGSGANFLVSWKADDPVNAPIVETVQTNFFGTHSAVFVSPAQPLHVPGATP